MAAFTSATQPMEAADQQPSYSGAHLYPSQSGRGGLGQVGCGDTGLSSGYHGSMASHLPSSSGAT